jgi:hypothetical protein
VRNRLLREADIFWRALLLPCAGESGERCAQMNAQKLSVGQELYMAPLQNRMGHPRFVRVTRVGRKWADVESGYQVGKGYDFGRIDIDSLYMDAGEYSPRYRCYLSKEEYEARVALQNAWEEFSRLVDKTRRAPENVTLSQIENARRALFK